MSNLWWELEKLRRRFDLDDEEFRRTVKVLTRKRRGAKPRDDGENLALIRTGTSADKVAAKKGLSRDAGTNLARKARRAKDQDLYQERIEEFADLIPSLGSICIERLREVAEHFPFGHLILADVSACSLRRVLEGGRLSTDRKDHVEAARFLLTMMDHSDLDDPQRRRAVREHIRLLDAVLQELRADKIT